MLVLIICLRGFFVGFWGFFCGGGWGVMRVLEGCFYGEFSGCFCGVEIWDNLRF